MICRKAALALCAESVAIAGDAGEDARCDTSEPERFVNDHLSTSRLKLYEHCPSAFKKRYIEKLPSSERALPLLLGVFLHQVMEDLFAWVIDEEFTGYLPEEKMLEFYRARWPSSALVGIDIYQEGLSILRGYVRRHPKVDHFSLLGVEVPFEFMVGRFKIVGRIDRVDKVDDETVRVIDLKSNRMLFSREETDADLQMDIYGLAVKRLWPWATRIEFVFHMLRHEVHLMTTRDDDRLQNAADYLTFLGEQTEADPEYPARLNPNCGYCDFRMRCDAYLDALAKKVELVVAEDDLEALANKREQVSTIAKLAYRRQRELDTILKARLEEQGELLLGGRRYSLLNIMTNDYPVDETIAKIASLTGMPNEAIQREILSIDKGRLDALIGRVRASSRSKAIVLESELDLLATKKPQASRLHVVAVKDGSRKKLPVHKGGDDGMEQSTVAKTNLEPSRSST